MTVEFAEKVKQYISDNLRIEIDKFSDYHYDGTHRSSYRISLVLCDVEISSVYAD